EFVLMEELLEEVGRDAARFTFLTRRHDSQLEFDLAVATRQSAENPVYYVQYARARIESIYKQAAEQGIVVPPLGDIDLSPLREGEVLGFVAGRCWPSIPFSLTRSAAADKASKDNADRRARAPEPTPTFTFYEALTAPLTSPPQAKPPKPTRVEKTEPAPQQVPAPPV